MHIYILLGGLYGLDGWIDSSGMLGLSHQVDKLPNTTVKSLSWSNYKSIIPEINQLTDKVVIIGYSGGGSRATWLANETHKQIDLLVAYDPSPKWQIKHLPNTVLKAVCYYNKSPWMFGLGGGKLTGPQVTTYALGEQHLGIQFNQDLHDITIAKIKELNA